MIIVKKYQVIRTLIYNYKKINSMNKNSVINISINNQKWKTRLMKINNLII